MLFTHADTLSHTTLLHTDAFKHRRFYTQMLLHANSFYTQTRFHTQTLFYTQTPLNTDTFTQTKASIAIFPQFLTSNVHFVRKGCGTLQSRIFSSVFDVQRPFRAKGLRGTLQSRNFSSVFDVQRPFRAKGLRGTLQSRIFSSVFDI